MLDSIQGGLLSFKILSRIIMLENTGAKIKQKDLG
jgi:hypothetical protein